MPAELSRSRTLNRFAVALSVLAIAMISYLAFPLPGFRAKARVSFPAAVKTVANDAYGKPDSGSRQRIQQMEAELSALQAEAAKNPARPTVAEMERELNRMVAERHSNSDVTRLERLARGSLAVSLILALALCGLGLLNLLSTRQPNQPTT